MWINVPEARRIMFEADDIGKNDEHKLDAKKECYE